MRGSLCINCINKAEKLYASTGEKTVSDFSALEQQTSDKSEVIAESVDDLQDAYDDMEIPLGLCDVDRINSLIDLDINELFLEKPCSNVSKVLSYHPFEWLQLTSSQINRRFFLKLCIKVTPEDK